MYSTTIENYFIEGGKSFPHFTNNSLEIEINLPRSIQPNINPSTHSSLIQSACACETVDIAPNKGGTWSKDDPRVVHQERVTLDEKKWDKVDEENEVARGNGEFSVTSASHKGEILFIRAPRQIATIRMNTVYELPDRRMAVPSKMLSQDENQYNTRNGNIEDNGVILDDNVNGRKLRRINKRDYGSVRRKLNFEVKLIIIILQ